MHRLGRTFLHFRSATHDPGSYTVLTNAYDPSKYINKITSAISGGGVRMSFPLLMTTVPPAQQKVAVVLTRAALPACFLVV